MNDQRAEEIAQSLAAVGQAFYSRGWTLGTSGNFSAVVSRDPLVLSMSPSGADKGSLSPEAILLIDEYCNVVKGKDGKPSAESPLHIRIAKHFGAGAVLHTHSVWSTMLSDVYAKDQGLAIEGYEMLKGLTGVTTHEHREWLPIFENSQDMQALATTVSDTLSASPNVHGFLLRRHGLYTWGKDLNEAKRQVEILEFLLEVVGRSRLMNQGKF